jgi:hypothetical protein
MLRRLLVVVAFALAACATTPAAKARETADAPAHELMGKLVGHWLLTGVIAGENVEHDVDAEWTLQGKYVRISEVAHETDDTGRPRYEATIFVGWLESAHHYVCVWLDNTEVASGEVTCTARQMADALPFEFRDAHGALMIATTFTYHRADDAWDWRIDNVENGRTSTFATLTLRRR